MNTDNDTDLLTAFRKLLAENKSQEERLADYSRIINSRDNEIEMLQKMLLEANEYRSNVDNKLTELKELQQYINDIQNQTTLFEYKVPGRQEQMGDSISSESQLEKFKMAYTDLQSQITELQNQLQDMNKRNLLLQVQTSRIAELESLLENASEGRLDVNQQGNQE